MKIQTAAELAGERPWLKVAIYGETGSGKTHWASMAPKPLVLLKEPQGLVTILDVCPDAIVIPIANWKQFCSAWNAIKKAGQTTTEDGQPASVITVDGVDHVYQTVVIDSFTDVQQMMIDGFDKGAKTMALDITRMTQEQWGRITGLTRRILDEQRALHANVIFTMLAHDDNHNEKRPRVLPSISGKYKGSAGQFFNAFGHATTRQRGDEIEHILKWKANKTFVTKPAPGWPDAMPSSITLGDLAIYSLGIGIAPHRPEDDGAKVHAIVEAFARKKEDAAAKAEADEAITTKAGSGKTEEEVFS